MEMPINILVVIVAAVIVLIALLMMFLGVWNPFPTTVNIESVKQAACREVVLGDCKSTGMIVDMDVNGDGTVGGGADTLQALCNKYYGCESAADKTSCCLQACGCKV